ncbi:MAG: response regulator transcription factor [Clostridia bacterium]|nr:response regulator transcription factor [Clostridia bacterium]
MRINVVVAEDDPRMRLVLRRTLEQIEGVYVVGSAANGEELLNLVEQMQPDVVFLDVDMPGVDGVTAAKEIVDIDPQIFIVFATGYSQYMEQAFEVYAFDYLLKPYRLNRIAKTMERIKELMALREQASKSSSPVWVPGGSARKLAVLVERNWVFLNADEIVMITRELRKTKIHTLLDSVSTYEPLGVIEKRLGGEPFLRCHRGYIINLNFIKELIPWGRDTYLVRMEHTDQTALMTEDKAEALRERFGLSAS